VQEDAVGHGGGISRAKCEVASVWECKPGILDFCDTVPRRCARDWLCSDQIKQAGADQCHSDST
jgi:hypothetical protein